MFVNKCVINLQPSSSSSHRLVQWLRERRSQSSESESAKSLSSRSRERQRWRRRRRRKHKLYMDVYQSSLGIHEERSGMSEVEMFTTSMDVPRLTTEDPSSDDQSSDDDPTHEYSCQFNNA